jgi:hypothetical protein
MGKKTDKFIKDISSSSEQCIRICGSLQKLSLIMEQNDDKWTDKVKDEMRQLGDWEKHPVAIERAKIWEKGMQLRRELQTDVNALGSSLSDFKKFIAKKEKSKNPFRSKKSLPAAKEMIKLFEGVQGELRSVWSRMGEVFR